MTGEVQRLLVVVPAHDEAELLGRCLRAVEAAECALGPGVLVRTVVVLDACVDDSAAVAAAHDVTTVSCTARNVGAARALGVRTLDADVTDPTAAWVATTDADSVVPRSWLLDQLGAARAGHDVLVGPVEPDPADVGPDLLRHWRGRHTRVGHHVHGANLGVRLSAYRAAGGFPSLPTGEDVALVSRLRALGADVVGGGRPALTSGRRHGRAPDGFSGYLRSLALELAPPEPA